VTATETRGQTSRADHRAANDARGARAIEAIGRIRRNRLARQFVKFCLVGGSGVAVNTVFLYLLHERLGLRLLLASPVAVEMAILNNFFWNNLWTFRATQVKLSRLAKFNLVSLGGLAITTGLLYLLAERYALVHYLVANLAGIAVATLWNFGVNLLWTWKRV
jgi:dolichol-phosphate mannosyltransferase